MSLLSFLKNKYGELIHSEVVMQVNLNAIPTIGIIEDFEKRIIDPDNKEDLKNWVEVVNSAYDDSKYDIETAKRLLKNHHFIENIETFMIFQNDNPCAAISFGNFRENKNAGGVFRIAVSKKYQNKGLGKYVILYAYNKLKERGKTLGESIISSHREKSILVHMSIGFEQQKDSEEINHKTANYNKNFVQKYRANRAYKQALKLFNEKR